jgi:hypothetical protein
LWERRREEVLKKKLGVLVSTLMMLAVMAASPAFAAPDNTGPGNTDNDPAGHSCGLNDPNAYKEGKSDEGEPGAGELGKVEENHPLEFGCAEGEGEPKPQQ